MKAHDFLQQAYQQHLETESIPKLFPMKNQEYIYINNLQIFERLPSNRFLSQNHFLKQRNGQNNQKRLQTASPFFGESTPEMPLIKLQQSCDLMRGLFFSKLVIFEILGGRISPFPSLSSLSQAAISSICLPLSQEFPQVKLDRFRRAVAVSLLAARFCEMVPRTLLELERGWKGRSSSVQSLSLSWSSEESSSLKTQQFHESLNPWDSVLKALGFLLRPYNSYFWTGSEAIRLFSPFSSRRQRWKVILWYVWGRKMFSLQKLILSRLTARPIWQKYSSGG